MALNPETGAGVYGADSYATRAFILAYWTARPHDALAATVAAADVDDLDGAAREASAYLDAEFGAHYRGDRKGYVQGLLWPRSGAKDDAGYDLPAIPEELKRAVAELAARALSARLAPDLERGGMIKREKIGPIEQEFAEGASADTRYGFVAKMLAPVLDGTQTGAPRAQWNWG
ncbi:MULTISPECIES: DnaT-like ssDNA-binding protein [Hyphobacterium]|uniref:DnaT-like ssDNA-binding protein n=1 Tax=Hyphobacterium vulgare TaxID=1736751 RepID=A0ABV6ZUA6_9PROT